MKLYLAGPLFTTPERTWNEALAARLEAAGHEVYVPHLHPAADQLAGAIFRKDKEGIDWAEGVVAIMDGADPDSGHLLGVRLRLRRRQAGRAVPERPARLGRLGGHALQRDADRRRRRPRGAALASPSGRRRGRRGARRIGGGPALTRARRATPLPWPDEDRTRAPDDRRRRARRRTAGPRSEQLAQLAEAGGIDSLWLYDHLIFRGPGEGEDESGIHEAWTLLAAVAAATERAELGTIVLGTGFRPPALTAKMAATIDEIADGRLILGLGAGWHEPEYTAFGYPFDHRVGPVRGDRSRSSCRSPAASG